MQNSLPRLSSRKLHETSETVYGINVSLLNSLTYSPPYVDLDGGRRPGRRGMRHRSADRLALGSPPSGLLRVLRHVPQARCPARAPGLRQAHLPCSRRRPLPSEPILKLTVFFLFSPSFPLFFILSLFIKSLPANPSPKRQNTKNMDRKQDAQEQARQRET